MSVVPTLDVCTWCVGDLRPLSGAPAVKVCVYCGRAVSFHAEPIAPVPLLLRLAPPADPPAISMSAIRAA